MNRQIVSKYARFVLAGALCAGVFTAAGVQAAPPGAAEDLQMETSRDMRMTAYRDANKAAPDAAPNGAYSPENIAYDRTHTGKWFIEEQRYGADAVAAGIADDNDRAIDRGLRTLEWGFAQEDADGTFPGTAGGQDWQVFHSQSFFVEAAAHSILLLEASPKGDKYQERLERIKPLLRRAALWMIRPEIAADGQAHNRPYTHRRYLVADALGEAGVACHEDTLLKKSGDYVRDGIAQQSPEGYNPEKGGTDTSYNAVGLVFAERYYVAVLPEYERITGHKSLRPALYAMIQKDIVWEASRISPDGTVSTEGNTRVGSGTEQGRNGGAKKVAKSQVYRCLFFWDYLSGSTLYESLGLSVAKPHRDAQAKLIPRRRSPALSLRAAQPNA